MASLRTWIARLLFFLRITDEEGVLSLTHAFVVISMALYVKHHDAVTAGVVAAAVANYATAKKVLPWLAATKDRSHEVELKKVETAADVKTTQEQVAKLAQSVRDLATPERLAAIREMRGPQAPQPRIPVVPQRL